MAKNLNMETVAEGVEDKKQSDLLKNMGCDIVQGYFYAKPMIEEHKQKKNKRYKKHLEKVLRKSLKKMDMRFQIN